MNDPRSHATAVRALRALLLLPCTVAAAQARAPRTPRGHSP